MVKKIGGKPIFCSKTFLSWEKQTNISALGILLHLTRDDNPQINISFRDNVTTAPILSTQLLWKSDGPPRRTLQSTRCGHGQPAGGIHPDQEASLGVAQRCLQWRSPGELARLASSRRHLLVIKPALLVSAVIAYIYTHTHGDPLPLLLSSPQVRLRGGRGRSSQAGRPPGGRQGADEAAGRICSPGWESGQRTFPESRWWKAHRRLPAHGVHPALWWRLLSSGKGTQPGVAAVDFAYAGAFLKLWVPDSLWQREYMQEYEEYECKNMRTWTERCVFVQHAKSSYLE